MTLRSRSAVAAARRHREIAEPAVSSPTARRRSTAGPPAADSGDGDAETLDGRRATPVDAVQPEVVAESLGAGLPATPPPNLEPQMTPGTRGSEREFGAAPERVSQDARGPTSPRAAGPATDQGFANLGPAFPADGFSSDPASLDEIKSEPVTTDVEQETDTEKEDDEYVVDAARLATSWELSFTGRTVFFERGSPTQPGHEVLPTPTRRIAACVLGGGSLKPCFPTATFPQLTCVPLWVSQSRLARDDPAEVAAHLEEAAADADIRYIFLCMPPGTGVKLATERQRAYEVCRCLPQWRRAALFHALAPRGSASAWRAAMDPLGTWKRLTVDAADHSGPPEPVDVFLLGFRARRPPRARATAASSSSRLSKQVLATIIADTLMMDLRAEFPGDPALLDGGRVHRHSSLGARVHDAAEEKRHEDRESKAGMRDPAELYERWPALWSTMARVAPVLLAARDSGSTFSGLVGCVGDAPRRPPPTELEIAALRAKVAEAFELSPGAAEQSHPAAPWRYNLVAAVQDAAQDPDLELRAWLRDGAPMGIRVPIVAGGLFPLKPVDAEISPEQIFEEAFLGNHPSFAAAGDAAPGFGVIQGHLDAGFGELFRDRAAAERHFGERVAPAPLGCISKPKADGSMKHRVIMDLKANAVNLATAVPERQVLPTVMSHAADLAELAEGLSPKRRQRLLRRVLGAGLQGRVHGGASSSC